MASLEGQTIASTYKQLLKITSEGVGADASGKYVEDGLGTDTALSLSTTRVGIGTTSVSSDATFGVSGNIELKNAGDKYWIPRQSDGALTGSIYSRTGSNVTISGAGSSSGQIEFIPSSANSSAVAMTIDSSQQVGIGTSSPNTTLTLSDGTDEFDFGVTTNQLMIKSVTSDGSDDQRIIIDAGNGGASSTRGAYIALSGNEASSEAGKAIYQVGNISGASHVFRISGGYDAFTIQNTGNSIFSGDYKVGIGQGTPTNSPLEVNVTPTNGNTGSSAFVHIGNGSVNTDGYISGLSLGWRENNANYRKTAIAVRARGDGAVRQDLCFLVDTANDGGSASLGDSKLTIDGLTGDATFTNNVGIGTTSPSEKLEVYDGDILVSSARGVRANGGNEMIRFDNSDGVKINSGGKHVISFKRDSSILHHSGGTNTGIELYKHTSGTNPNLLFTVTLNDASGLYHMTACEILIAHIGNANPRAVSKYIWEIENQSAYGSPSIQTPVLVAGDSQSITVASPSENVATFQINYQVAGTSNTGAYFRVVSGVTGVASLT